MENPKSVGGIIGELFEDLKDSLLGNERLSEMMQFADKNGFEFKKRIPFAKMDYELKSFKFFKGKGNKKVRNVMQRDSKALKAEIFLFDYTFQNDYKKTSSTCIILESELFKLPKFRIQPKKKGSFFSRFFSRKTNLGLEYPEFDKSFLLTGLEDDYIPFFLTPQLVDLMLSEPTLTIEGHKKYLLIYEKNKVKAIEDLLPFYDLGLDMSHILLFDNSNDYV